MHTIVNDRTGKPINLAAGRMKIERDGLEELYKPVGELLKGYNCITEERAQQVIDYSMQMLIKNVSWKPEKIVRKTVEYFKLKKVITAE